MTSELRPAWAEIDLAAVRANVRALCAAVAPAELLAVVKADGYGHGAVPVARAALDAGATRLGVALVEEGVELRAAGIDAPVLVLSEHRIEAAETVVGNRLVPIVYTPGAIDSLAKAVAARGSPPLPVHLKVDTGMHRVGCRPDDALTLAHDIAERAELVLEGVCTHFAAADEPELDYTVGQVERFESVLQQLRDAGIDPGLVHASNTAGALAYPEARYDFVRVGIGIYGIPPAPAFAGKVRLRPALSLHACVSHVKEVGAGARISYGLRYTTPRATRIATVPLGYADGIPRRLGHLGGEVIVHGVRCPIAGAVTMDQLMVDVGRLPVQVGDEVVLIGRQGGAEVSATDWAELVGTIGYEIVCGIGPRVPRRYVGEDGR
jgi:alanine racemase